MCTTRFWIDLDKRLEMRNNLKVFGSNKTKGSKQDSHNRLYEEGEPVFNNNYIIYVSLLCEICRDFLLIL